MQKSGTRSPADSSASKSQTRTSPSAAPDRMCLRSQRMVWQLIALTVQAQMVQQIASAGSRVHNAKAFLICALKQ